jgi:hypothetical protein
MKGDSVSANLAFALAFEKTNLALNLAIQHGLADCRGYDLRIVSLSLRNDPEAGSRGDPWMGTLPQSNASWSRQTRDVPSDQRRVGQANRGTGFSVE